MYLIAKDNQD